MIPKASSEERMAENLDIFSFELEPRARGSPGRAGLRAPDRFQPQRGELMLLRRTAAAAADGAPAPFQRQASVRTIAVEGTAQRFWDFPAADPGTAGPAIFMVHGFRGDHHGLLRLVEALPNNRVILPDLPGFGQGAVLPGSARRRCLRGFCAHRL